jgi:hypothetical protein
MFNRCIEVEWLKIRRSKVWIIVFTIPLLSVLIGCANFYLNQGVLQSEWYSLWSQVGLFYGLFFLPLLIAICCAYSYRLEHLQHNWHTLLTAPVSVSAIILSKLVVIALLLLAVQFFLLMLYLGAGIIVGLALPLPPEILNWTICGWLASVTIASLQMWVSQRIRSFTIPIGIAFACLFVGLGAYVANVGMFFPYSLLTLGLGALSQEALSIPDLLLFIVVNICLIIAFSALSIRHLYRADASEGIGLACYTG